MHKSQHKTMVAGGCLLLGRRGFFGQHYLYGFRRKHGGFGLTHTSGDHRTWF